MILFLCYVFPPLAVLFMGRPFSAVLNSFLTMFFYLPGMKHALICYADYKANQSVEKITNAIHNPHHVQASNRARQRRPKPQVVERVVYDNPHVGANGTKFRPKT
jgi:uncharacterized membrane protein YqaE (UPF0057 family)